MMRVLVTGATGFVGRRLTPALIDSGMAIRAAVRTSDSPGVPAGVDVVVVGDIGPETDWRPALDGIDAVVHLAARVHVMKREAADSEALYRRVNAEGTAGLAHAAAALGIKRFVYISTTKVMGEASGDRPFRETDAPAPVDAYGRSKWEGEQALAQAAAGGMDAVVVRPPMVYGPGVGGNVLTLLKACWRAPPLPFAGVDNRRSVIYVGNLVSAIARCVEHAQAPGRTYFVRDTDDVSTPELIRRIAAALSRPARLFAAPGGMLRLLGALTGKSAAIARLTGTLQVDDGAIRHDLDWTPPIDMVQGLNETAAWFTSSDRRRDDGDAAL